MEFVTFEIAKKLKKKGYPQVKKNTLAMYDEDGYWYSLVATTNEECRFEDFDEHDCVCPAISQVLKWLRKEKHLHVEIKIGDAWAYDIYKISSNEVFVAGIEGSLYIYTSYELAALAGIEYILDNLI